MKTRLLLLCVIIGTVAPAGAASPVTAVLISESALRQQYPQNVSYMLRSVQRFVQDQNGYLIDVGAESNPRSIKGRLVRHSPWPQRLVIFGDERGIPRFKVRISDSVLDTDYFYGDLDQDGIAEVAVTRVLGNPQAMVRQLGGGGSVGEARSLLLTDAILMQHLEMNQFATVLSDLGYSIEARGGRDLQALANATLIVLGGHGDPNGWYGAGGAYVTADTVPDLPNHPIVFAGACSTATPGSPILRTFLEKGCRVYIGAASPSYGWTPAYLGNELTLHLLDTLSAHPDWSVAELVGEARNRYIRGNRLESLLRRLENGESPDRNVAVTSTALQYQVFGDITAVFPRGKARPLFTKQALVNKSAMVGSGGSIPVRYYLGPAQGSPVLFLHADWDENVTAGLELEVVQDGALLHAIDWRKQREWWEFVFISAGGYWGQGRYHAYALLPLTRKEGSNDVKVILKQASRPIQLQADSTLQIWPRQWPVVLSPQSLSRILDVFATESAYLGHLGGYDNDLGANSPRRQDHLAWATTQPIERFAKNLINKYCLQFDRQARISEAAGRRFYAEASARLAACGVDLGDPGANLRQPGPHLEWARRQDAAKLRGGIEEKVRKVMAGAALDRH